MELTVQSVKDQESYVELPILYYKGYVAKDVDTGQRLEVESGENSVVRVLLPANYSGTIQVYFGSLWYWRVAEVISLLTLSVILWQIGHKVRRKRREKVAVVEK